MKNRLVVAIINFTMYALVFIVTTAIFSATFGWLIKKTNFNTKLMDKINKYKHSKSILVSIFFVFAISVNYAKTLLDEKLGQHNIITLILGSILVCLYVKFVPFIFIRKK